ncbi:MAG: CPBP family glutamic-type intramembrane protease [Candidatus Hodarchaeales archaeon]
MISDTISLMIIITSNLIYIIILTKYSPYKHNIRKIGSNHLPNILTIIGLFILCLSFLELTLTFLNYFFDQLSIPPSFSSPYDDYLGNPSNAIIFAFLVMCIGPIFEEIVFRKHVSYFLESNISSKLFVIFLTGVIFSLNHLPADLLNGSFRFTLEHLYVVFILGLVLGVIYYWNSFTFLTQNENLIPDPVLLSNLLFVLGLISIIILPGIIVYKEKEKVTNMKNSLCDRLSSKKLSLSVFTNTLAIITYEFLVAILLVTYQSVLSTLLLLGIHSLGIILGFIVLDIDLRTSNNFQEQ